MGVPYRRVPIELKEKIFDVVKNDGIPVSQAAKEYGVSPQSIHAWLRKESEGSGIGNTHHLGEIRRLQKEEEDLLLLIGALNVEVNKLKKKKY